MKAEDVRVTQLLEGPKQFIVPVFQRDYSWGTKQCLQLWNDIVRVGSDPCTKAHFIGSVVYIAAEDNNATITRWLLIDGQQRLTTLTLLLVAVRNRLSDIGHEMFQSDETDSLPTSGELQDYYLHNAYGKGDRRHKLHLRRADRATLAAIVDNKASPANASDRISENLAFFKDKLAVTDIELVYRGIRKLVAVDVSLTRGQDDPQMIFESLNSTGLDLTQADLIRNYVLMRQDEQLQTRLYQDYWEPIETAFGQRYRSDFDKFVRDYLTLLLKPSKQLKSDDIYHQFRTCFLASDGTDQVESILADLHRLGNYYASFNLGKESDADLKEVFQRLRLLIDVASPVVMRLYNCYDRKGTLTV